MNGLLGIELLFFGAAEIDDPRGKKNHETTTLIDRRLPAGEVLQERYLAQNRQVGLELALVEAPETAEQHGTSIGYRHRGEGLLQGNLRDADRHLGSDVREATEADLNRRDDSANQRSQGRTHIQGDVLLVVRDRGMDIENDAFLESLHDRVGDLDDRETRSTTDQLIVGI